MLVFRWIEDERLSVSRDKTDLEQQAQGRAGAGDVHYDLRSGRATVCGSLRSLRHTGWWKWMTKSPLYDAAASSKIICPMDVQTWSVSHSIPNPCFLPSSETSMSKTSLRPVGTGLPRSYRMLSISSRKSAPSSATPGVSLATVSFMKRGHEVRSPLGLPSSAIS